MVNKHEVIGIFLSIAFMALILAVFRFGDSFSSLSAVTGGDQPSAVFLASSDTSDIREAVSDNTTINGDLRKLIIDDVRAGSGAAVKSGDTITVDYVGMLQDGTQFDSSYARGESYTFTVGKGEVIEGWDEGVLGMQEGGQRVIVVPSHMAYGNAQVGPIPPNSVLVFSIELVSIK